MGETHALLAVDRVSKSFGGVRALDGVSLRVPDGGLVGLIGPNGSGKSTLFNVISGFYRADAGAVRLGGEDITGLSPDAIARRGLVRTFQLVRPLGSFTVYETLLLAARAQPGERPLAALLLPARRWLTEAARRRAEELLALTGLERVRDHLTTELSFGQQKLLSLAAAVMTGPKLLMLDEPMAGVNPTLARTLREAILELRRRGVAFLIVEHDLEFVMETCDWIYVLDHGVGIAEGPPAAVRSDAAVIEAYMGGPVHGGE